MTHATWWLLLDLQAQHWRGVEKFRGEEGSQPWDDWPTGVWISAMDLYHK